jgi:Tol biopolymer transport system component
MTERPSLDRELTVYLEGRSTNRAPVGLLEATLTMVEQTRQRPAWFLVGRRLSDRRPAVSTPPVSARLVLVAVMLFALLIAALVVAGSQRRLPPPFGPARSGVLLVEFGGHIGVMRADGTGRVMLTSGPESDSYPIWSPDGTRFAFTSYQEESYALVVMDADGGNRITLADHLLGGVWVGGGVRFGPAIGLSWSPDSKRIAFSARIGDAAEQQIYVTDADRPDATRIGAIDVYGISPSWSSDGSLIVFKRIYRCCGIPPDSLWLIGPDGSNLHPLSATTGARESLMGTTWSPDGKRLAFIAPGKDLNLDIFVINADGTGETNITQSVEDEFFPSWSPDGRKIAFSRVGLGASSLGTGVFVIDPDGTNPVPVPTGTTGVSTLVWSPDGSRILGYVEGGLGGADSIAVLDPTGRKPPVDIPLPGVGSASWQRLAP